MTFTNGHVPWNKGKADVYTEETLQKLSEASQNHPPITEETRQKQSASHKGQVPWNKGRKHSEDTRQKIREGVKNRPPMTEETRQRRSKAQQKLWQDSEYAQKVRETHKAQWQDPEYIQSQRVGRSIKPNKAELNLLEILRPLGFSFVGDWTLMINGKCPDFWNGDKKLIELYGDYWHRDQDPQDRIDLFKAASYDCLVIWEHELRDNLNTVIERVTEFSHV